VTYAIPATTKTVSAKLKEPLVMNNGILRQRKLGAVAAITAALAPLQKLHLKVQDPSTLTITLPAVVLLLLKGLHSVVARSVLGTAVVSALLLLVAESVTCLVSLLMASKLPAGLFFMVAALGLMCVVGAQAILHDSASIQRRKSSRALLNR
jgi:hypothetical protein